MREAIPTWFYALVVVRSGHRFLLVKEKEDGSWYLPAGRVEVGENIAEAARRETLEEAGIPIVLEGILRVEHTPNRNGARLRVFFVARPADDSPPKSVPDAESEGADWVSLDGMARLKLRSPEVRDVCEHVAAGGAIHPLELLTFEGRPWKRR